MDTATILDCIRICYFTPDRNGMGLPLLLEGPPGIGKTAQIEQTAVQFGAEPVTVLASIREPEDFAGLPVPDGAGSLSRLPDGWARRANEAAESGNGALVFFDEINHASSRVFAALLRVINERCVGDLSLHRNVRIIAAQNAVSEGGGSELPAPLANRFGHLRWPTPRVDEFTAWFVHYTSASSGVSVDVETLVASRFDVEFALARARVGAFLNANPGHFYKRPDASDIQSSYAWPSPRTWEMAARAMATCAILNASPTVFETLVAAFVGEPAAVAFAQWASKLDLPDVEALLDGRVQWAPNPARPDVTDAVLGSCVAIARMGDPKSRENRLVRTFEVVHSCVKVGVVDAGYVHAQALIKDPETLKCGPRVVAAARPTLSALGAETALVQNAIKQVKK